MYKLKVMDELDALLTELQSSTKSVTIIPQVEPHPARTLLDDNIMDRRIYAQYAEPASADILDSEGEPLYQMQSVKPVRPSHQPPLPVPHHQLYSSVQKKSVNANIPQPLYDSVGETVDNSITSQPLYDSVDNLHDSLSSQPLYASVEETFGNMMPAQPFYSSVQRSNPNATPSLPQYASVQKKPNKQIPPQPQYASVQKKQINTAMTKAMRHTATLSSNLSELDNLLAELNTSRYLTETEKPRPDVEVTHQKRVDDRAITSPNSSIAISATRELDDLMASLSDLDIQHDQAVEPPRKIPPTVSNPANLPTSTRGGPSPTVLPAGGGSSINGGGSAASLSLNALMADLDKNMTQQGVTTIPKGHCAACAKPIVGQVITALARLWHPEHFVCVHCQEPLGTRNFFERDSMPYCEEDYHLLFSPTCALCGDPVLDKCVTAMDKTWHPEHFFCVRCQTPLGSGSFHERDGQPYCEEDYYELFAPKCGRCSEPIVASFITALNQQWHSECFVCADCNIPFHAGNFFEHDGLPYCEIHFHGRRGSLCSGCGKPVTGRCITAMSRKFHPEHFVCTYCQRQLNKGTFKEQNDRPYCQVCFARLFN